MQNTAEGPNTVQNEQQSSGNEMCTLTQKVIELQRMPLVGAYIPHIAIARRF